MAFWESVASGTLKGLMGGVGALAKDLRTAITGEEPLSNEQQVELLKQVHALESLAARVEEQAASGQIELNKLDAQSGSMFKGGWRPAIGWICSFGLFYSFIMKPILPWLVAVGGIIVGKAAEIPALPALDMKELMALVLALLGFGGYRMYEKVRGVAAK